MTDKPNKKILLIDDDTFLLDMYALKFSKAGYEVKSADSSELGLKIVREGYVPDVILADIVMPGMDGLEMIAAMRKERLITDALVIMLTNQGSPDDVGRASKMNVDGYIIKATTIPSQVLAEVEKIGTNSKKSDTGGK